MKKLYFLELTLLVACAPAIQAHADTITYDFSVNTSSQAAKYGYIDMELNQGTLNSPAVTATITDLSTDGTLDSSDINNYESAGVSGTLPGTVSITAAPSTDYFEGLTFSSYVDFDVTLSGPGVNLSGNAGGTSGSLFQLSFYDSTGSNPLLTSNSSGINSEVSIDQTGTPTPMSLDPSATISATPEPTTLSLLGLGAATLTLMAQRRKTAA